MLGSRVNWVVRMVFRFVEPDFCLRDRSSFLCLICSFPINNSGNEQIINMYKVQFLATNVNRWANCGSYGSEQGAIISAKIVLQRKYVQSVRVVDRKGQVLWSAN